MTPRAAFVLVPGFGASNNINTEWVPPMSLLGTPNTPRDAEHLTSVLVAMAIGWVSVALTIRALLSRKKFNGEYVSRVTSLIHSTFATIYSGYNVFLRYQQSKTTGTFAYSFACLDEPPLADEQYVSAFIAAYFLYDTVGLFVGGYYDTMYLVHHLASLSVLLAALFSQTLGPEVSSGIVVLECTGILLHYRWLLGEHKVDVANPRGIAWLTAEYGYLTLFFIARVIVGNLLILSFLPIFCPKNPWFAGCVVFAIFAYSTVFFVEVIKKKRRGEKWTA